MASYVYEVESPEGDTRTLHLDDQASESNLVDALGETFPQYDFAQSEISGRDGGYRVELREGGAFSVRKQGRQESE